MKIWLVLIRDLGGVCRHTTVKSSKYLMHHVRIISIIVIGLNTWVCNHQLSWHHSWPRSVSATSSPLTSTCPWSTPFRGSWSDSSCPGRYVDNVGTVIDTYFYVKWRSTSAWRANQLDHVHHQQKKIIIITVENHLNPCPFHTWTSSQTSLNFLKDLSASFSFCRSARETYDIHQLIYCLFQVDWIPPEYKGWFCQLVPPQKLQVQKS